MYQPWSDLYSTRLHSLHRPGQVSAAGENEADTGGVVWQEPSVQ